MSQEDAAAAFLARARELVPVFRERADECYALRRIPDATAADIRAAGLHRVMQPTRFGGRQLGWDVMCEIGLMLAYGCPSQAWVTAIYADHSNHAARFPLQAQEDVWGDSPDALISSSLIPKGQKTTAVEGGFVLDGRYGFSSGVHHADWGIIGCLREQEGAAPEYFYCLVPAADWKIHDDWHVAGMAGTGSCSIDLADVFVPAHRTLTVLDALSGTGPGSDAHAAAIYYTPHRLMGPFVFAAIAVGATEAILEEYIEYSDTGSQVVQLRIAEGAAELAAARRMLVETVARVMDESQSGPISRDFRRVVRRDAPYAMRLTRQAMDRIFAASGARGNYDGDRIQRLAHDVNAIGSHIGLRWDLAAPLYAQHRLGLDVLATAL